MIKKILLIALFPVLISSQASAQASGPTQGGLATLPMSVPAAPTGMAIPPTQEEYASDFVNLVNELLSYPSDVALSTLGDMRVSSIAFYARAHLSSDSAYSSPLPDAGAIHEWVKAASEKMGYQVTGNPKDPKIKFALYCEVDPGRCIGFVWIIRDVSFDYSHHGGPKKSVAVGGLPIVNWKGIVEFDDSKGSVARSEAAFELSKRLLSDMSKSVLKANIRQ